MESNFQGSQGPDFQVAGSEKQWPNFRQKGIETSMVRKVFPWQQSWKEFFEWLSSIRIFERWLNLCYLAYFPTD